MAKDLEVAIVFADVVGSTQLYDKFGDTKASETVAACLEIMKDATFQFNGTVIKTIGDEVMSTFVTVDEAMGASVMMQTRISAVGKKEDGIPVSIRIGCHYGPVVQEQNDIFGAAVHTANRMTSQAKPEEATSMLPTIEWENKGRRASKLLLNFKDSTIEVSDQRKSINLGRADDNDLVIKGNLISRIHAKIEMRRGKFVLVDQSTNGTFLQDLQGQSVLVRRDSTELGEEGTIGLGRTEEPGSSLAIYYKTIE